MNTPSTRDATWRLIRDDLFDRVRTESDLTALVDRISSRSATPYSEVVRSILGMERIGEEEARELFGRLVEHWRTLSRSLGRVVNVRVAALDLVTMGPARVGAKSEARPIVVTPSLLEKA